VSSPGSKKGYRDKKQSCKPYTKTSRSATAMLKPSKYFDEVENRLKKMVAYNTLKKCIQPKYSRFEFKNRFL
jgi:hypothetical protein